MDWLIATSRGGPARRRGRTAGSCSTEGSRVRRSAVRIEAGRLHAGPPRASTRSAIRASPGEGRWMAAVLAVGAQAVLSHRSAAALWGLLDDYGPIDVSSPPERHGRANGPSGRTGPPPSLPCNAPDATESPCTTVARTLLDLAATARAHTVTKAVKAGGVQAAVRPPRDRCDRGATGAGRRLRARARGAVDRIDEYQLRARGPLPRARARAPGLPRPEINAAISGPRAPPTSLDFLWRDSGLVVETNGFARPRRRVVASTPIAAARCACATPASRCSRSPGRM